MKRIVGLVLAGLLVLSVIIGGAVTLRGTASSPAAKPLKPDQRVQVLVTAPNGDRTATIALGELPAE